MLRPYVTAWGSDPVWESALPALPPTVAGFPRHAGSDSGLTLAELPPALTVVVAAHDVQFDRDRKLWYCDIEVDPGDTYYPFVRLALARYQAHSLTGAHLSRVVMTDFIQLAPDRTADVSLSDTAAEVEVSGFAGRNRLGGSPLDDVVGPDVGAAGDPPTSTTTMRVALERRAPGVPGDLGWQRVGAEITLTPKGSANVFLSRKPRPFHVTWNGVVPLPRGAVGQGDHRLLVTEVETYLRDYPIPGDPNYASSPSDFLRERVVYTDTFEL